MNREQQFNKKKKIDTQEIREKTIHLSVYYLIGIVYTRL